MVLFVSYSGVLGGAERLLVDYAAALEQERALACPEGALAAAARAAGLRVLALPHRSLALRGRGRAGTGAAATTAATTATAARATVRLAAHALELRRLQRDLGAELVVAWGMRSAIAAMGAGARFVFAHNDLLPGPLVAVAVRAAARRARSVVVLSHAIAADLGVGRITVLHPGIDVDAFDGSGRDPALAPEVVMLGALVDWKRPDLALEAVALARRRVPELRLTLVGAPIDADAAGAALVGALRARAARPDLAGAVSLAGFEPDPRGALARASCLLHCAPREPFGLAVLEALAAGRPAVVPDAYGPAEIVDASCGLRYAPGDSAAAADALVAIATDPSRAAAMGQRGRERARRRFDRGAARARFAQVIAAAKAGAAGAAEEAGAAGAPAIVTVTHNSAASLPALLDSLARHLPDAEIVVVDCASTDDSIAVARARPGVTAIELGENVGFGRACNRGLAHVGARVTALLNPDVELVDDSLRVLAREALRCERLLAPLVLNGDGSRQDTAHPLPGSAADLVRALLPPAALPGRAGVWLAPWRSSRPRPVGWAVGCALVARTATLIRLGPFDESIFMYGEDLELALHARAEGVQTWLWPAARVIHHRAHSSAAAFAGEPFELLARGRHRAVAMRQGRGRAARDDAAQAVTFASRIALKRALGRPAERERRQLAAVASLWHRRR